MGERADEQARDEDHVYVSAEMSFSDSPTVSVRTLMFGLTPAVLITPDVSEEERRYGFNVSSVDLDAESLVSILRLCADHIETADQRDRAEGSDR